MQVPGAFSAIHSEALSTPQPGTVSLPGVNLLDHPLAPQPPGFCPGFIVFKPFACSTSEPDIQQLPVSNLTRKMNSTDGSETKRSFWIQPREGYFHPRPPPHRSLVPPRGILKVHAQSYSPSSLPNCTTLAHQMNAETILPSNAPLHQITQRVQRRRVQFSDNATNLITPIIAQSRDEDEIQVDRRPRLAQGNKIDAVIDHPDILSWSFR